MKANLLDINGKKVKTIDLPSCFSKEVREDIIAKVLETKKTKQPYSPSPVAGNQYSASGVLIHQRHVWKSQYGRGISRVPRKIMSRKGSQFNWVGATAPNTVGGRRSHPPKVISMLKFLKINKNENKIAFASALSATANNEIILKNARRLWWWHAKKSISLTGVSLYGLNYKKSKVCAPIDLIWLQPIEIIIVSEVAKISIQEIPDAEIE